MDGLSEKNFGLLIAYVIPGVVAVHGLGAVSPTVAQWIAVPPASPTLSGFLFAFVSSLGVGIFASAVRWLLVDTLHHKTGVRLPSWNYSQLENKLVAFHALVISHYRYYQFYANLFVVIPFWWTLQRWAAANQPVEGIALVAVECVLFFGSRDALRKYYIRAGALLEREPVIITELGKAA